MSDYSAGTATIEASSEAIFAILKDLDSYPQWSASIKSVEIAERDGAGNPSKANLKVEAGVLKDRVSLDYDWSKAPNEISFTLEDAGLLTEMSGIFNLKSLDADTTEVSYQLKVALSMPVPDIMRKKQEQATIDQELAKLKAHAEG
jgi:ribosome-associated toxin RatA of RatAB toxin-antitoxin module